MSKTGSVLRSVIVAWLMCAAPLVAQSVPDGETLAEIEAELQFLREQLATMRAELATSNAANAGIVNPAPLLERAAVIEAELVRLTGQVEAAKARVERVVADGTNRIADLEFRLTELEGGDLAALPETPPLGEGTTTPRPVDPDSAAPSPGPLAAAPRPAARPGTAAPGPVASAEPQPEGGLTVTPTEPSLGNTDLGPASPDAVSPNAGALDPVAPDLEPEGEGAQGARLAVGEQADFDAAFQAFRDGAYSDAAEQFAAFNRTYPGGALSGEASFYRGESLAATGNYSAAARSYLDSFSGSPDSATAPAALYRLGLSLGRLGQTEEACLTLSEVPRRYPAASPSILNNAQSERAALGCAG